MELSAKDIPEWEAALAQANAMPSDPEPHWQQRARDFIEHILHRLRDGETIIFAPAAQRDRS